MITNLVRSIVQFGGTSMFEKARLSATYKGDYHSPNESDIDAIMLTLSGKDPETRPQIGFTTILEKLETSQSIIYWNYIIKNLIIVDRCIEYRFFVSDIANMNVKYVENYTEKNQKYKQIGIDSFIRKYYLYLKKKAALYSLKKSSFNTPKEEKKNYFKQQSVEHIYEEFFQGQQLFDSILDISIHDRNGLLKYRVNQYVYQILLFTLLNIYYNSYVMIVIIIERLLKMPIDEVKQFKDIYNKFLHNNETLVNFINSRLFIKGFSDIKTSDVARIDTRIIGAIEEYIKIADKCQNQTNLPKEIQLTADFIDEDLIFDQVEKIRASIYQRDDQNGQDKDLNHRVGTILISQQQSIYTLDQKLKDFTIKYLKKYPQSEFNLDGYKDDIFKGFFNNFSTEYIAIDPKLFKQMSLPIERESKQPQNSIESENYDDQIKIEFILSNNKDFDEQIFDKIENIYCFEIQKLLENIDDFPNADEDDFPDYEGD